MIALLEAIWASSRKARCNCAIASSIKRRQLWNLCWDREATRELHGLSLSTDSRVDPLASGVDTQPTPSMGDTNSSDIPAHSRIRASRLLASCPVDDETRCLGDSNCTSVERQICGRNVTKNSRGGFVVVAEKHRIT
jgi:hypothetical protein